MPGHECVESAIDQYRSIEDFYRAKALEQYRTIDQYIAIALDSDEDFDQALRATYVALELIGGDE